MNKIKQSTLIWFIVFLLSSSIVFPQAGRGINRISGKVTDEQGNPISAAKITIHFLENEKITREIMTDKKGKWKITRLGSGDWRIVVSAEGFIPYQDNIFVSQLEVNPPLKIVLKKAEKQLIEEALDLELYEKGNQLFKEEKYEEALAHYQEFLARNPELYQVHFGLGNCYKKMGKIDKALEEFQIILERANEENEKDRKLKAMTLASIGECYLIREDMESAQDFFKKSLELNPQHEILAYNVGEIYFAHQKMDEAIDYFTLSIQIKPDWSDPYYKMGLVHLNKKNNDKAIMNFEKFLELEPDTERSANVKNIIEYLKKL